MTFFNVVDWCVTLVTNLIMFDIHVRVRKVLLYCRESLSLWMPTEPIGVVGVFVFVVALS